MQAYLGSPTTPTKEGGIIMTDVKTVSTKIITIPVVEFLERLHLSDIEGELTDVGMYLKGDGLRLSEKMVELTIKSEVEEVNI